MNPRPVALVTGSGKRRVGWHVADALAARGYALVLHYRHFRRRRRRRPSPSSPAAALTPSRFRPI